ncbi:hypothetical protein GUJ93_ZPchr0152g29215 [Zizania palustris]|uniref:Uncharacterized protein n=1 Tax=Zizania palustris TaxID=103762 RepID=A0A8J5UVF9_ZIZPA|nr:hypothetical protein GUJ93_ZPchr0152g29215 [Zizania palustris]
MIKKAARSVVAMSPPSPGVKDHCHILNCNLLDLLVSQDSPLLPANFGSSPKFGQEVFALARNEESSLFARRGPVLWQEPMLWHWRTGD